MSTRRSRRRGRAEELKAIREHIKKNGVDKSPIQCVELSLSVKGNKKWRSQKTSIHGIRFQFPECEIRYYHTHSDGMRASRLAWKGHKNVSAKNERIAKQLERHGSDAHYLRCNKAERKFLRYAGGTGTQVQRAGWPDFLCETSDGEVVAVEVKNGVLDQLQPDQVRCFRILEKSGLRIFVWNKNFSKWTGAPHLIPWRHYLEKWPEMDRSVEPADGVSKGDERET